MKIMIPMSCALLVSFGMILSPEEKEEGLDLGKLKSANAWGHCIDWAPESVGQPDWFDVSRRFPDSEKQRIDAEYPQFRILADNKRFCLLGGTDVCENLDIAVSQTEIHQGTFGAYSADPPL